MLTIDDVMPTGRFNLLNEAGTVVAYGRAVPSKTHPGMVTLTWNIDIKGRMQGLRVPIDWIKYLEEE